MLCVFFILVSRISRLSRETGKLLVLLSLSASSGCASPPTAAEIIPGTRVTLDELFFLPGEERLVRFSEPVSLCLTSDWRREYRGAGIGRITGQSPFNRLDELPASCPVSLLGPRDPVRIGNARTFESPACRISFRATGGRLEAVEGRVVNAAAASYRECAYRLALFVEGYNGAATLEPERLFIDTNRTIFAGETTIVGESIPFVVHQLRLLCTGVAPRDNLSRADLRGGNLCRREL